LLLKLERPSNVCLGCGTIELPHTTGNSSLVQKKNLVVEIFIPGIFYVDYKYRKCFSAYSR